MEPRENLATVDNELFSAEKEVPKTAEAIDKIKRELLKRILIKEKTIRDLQK